MHHGGIDYPPCWVTPRGSIEFIFSIIIFDDNFLIEKIFDEQKFNLEDEFVFNDDKLNSVIKSDAFDIFCEAIFNKCKELKCRHFVKIIDKTTNKNSYKSQLQNIEKYFYKILK